MRVQTTMQWTFSFLISLSLCVCLCQLTAKWAHLLLLNWIECERVTVGRLSQWRLLPGRHLLTVNQWCSSSKLVVKLVNSPWIEEILSSLTSSCCHIWEGVCESSLTHKKQCEYPKCTYWLNEHKWDRNVHYVLLLKVVQHYQLIWLL